MKLNGAQGQVGPHFYYDASGAVISSTVPQLILPRPHSRSMFIVANLSPTFPMYLEFGSARAVATISGGVVTAITLTNPGFGFSLPPVVQLRGGKTTAAPSSVVSADPNSGAPPHTATAHCVMSGSVPNQVVASIVVDYGGSGYVTPPYVLIMNPQDDPYGCADPSYGGFSGVPLAPNGGNYYVNGTSCSTDQMALYCPGGAAAKFTCKWMD